MPASDIPVHASDTETVISPKVEATGVVLPAGVPDKTVHHDSEPARPSHKRCSVIPEAMAPNAPVKHRRVDARCWNFVIDKIDNWRHQEGEPRYEMEEGPLAQIHPITDEPIHRTIPLLVARLVHLDRQIEKNHVHQRKVSVARVTTSEQEIEALRARAARAKANVAILRDVLWIAGDRITDLKFQAEDTESRLHQCERGRIQDSARIRRLEEHLGVTIDDRMTRIKAWENVIVKLRSRLSKWKVKTLSSIFKVPCGVLKIMEAIRSRFFNGIGQDDSKITWIAWNKVLASKKRRVYHPQNHPTHYTQNSSTRSQQAATWNIGKAIVNSPQPIYDQEPSMVVEDDKTSKDKEIDKIMALISLSFKKIYKPTNNNLRTSSNTSRVNQDNSPRINRSVGYENQRIGNVDGARETVGSSVVQKSRIQCYNYKEFGHVARECQKLKRAKDATYHREKMLLCKQEEARIQLNAEQADWRDDTDDDELEDQELEAHYMYMAQPQEVSPDTADSGPIFDDEPLQKVSNNDHYNVFAIESIHPEQSKSVNDTYPIEQDQNWCIWTNTIPPRVGNEYQIKLPSMITVSDYFDYMRNPIDALEDEESNGVLPTNFLIGLDIPIVWIYPKPQNLKSDLGNMRNENVLSLIPGLFFQ
nr:RNA-directed DNA polymerase, eukaryota [Tanacetum cinerariifolium]